MLEFQCDYSLIATYPSKVLKLTQLLPNFQDFDTGVVNGQLSNCI